MPILVSLLGFTLMFFGTRAAIQEKEELTSHPTTWKGEMLCPPGQENCNDSGPNATPTLAPFQGNED